MSVVTHSNSERAIFCTPAQSIETDERLLGALVLVAAIAKRGEPRSDQSVRETQGAAVRLQLRRAAVPELRGGAVKIVQQGQDIATIRAQAQAWYERQLEVCRRSLGSSWPEHERWVIDYLKTELRERLIARGWRSRNGR